MQSFPAPYPSATTTVPPSTSSTSSHSTPDPASPVTPPSTLPPRSIASSDSSSDTRPSTNYASTQTHQTDEAERQLVANHQFASMMATLTMQMGGSGPPNSNVPPLPSFGMMQPPPPPPPGAMNELIPFFLVRCVPCPLELTLTRIVSAATTTIYAAATPASAVAVQLLRASLLEPSSLRRECQSFLTPSFLF